MIICIRNTIILSHEDFLHEICLIESECGDCGDAHATVEDCFTKTTDVNEPIDYCIDVLFVLLCLPTQVQFNFEWNRAI